MKYVSVIVTYNRVELLKECIEAMLRQNIELERIIVVDNCSTDGTREFLQQFENDSRFYIFHSDSNEGGAYGFYKGVEIAQNLSYDWLLLIDDDAILNENYLYFIDKAIETDEYKYKAYAGVVTTNNEVCVRHRARMQSPYWFKPLAVVEREYKKTFFLCDVASFCGLTISKELVQKIGLPLYEYFIWHDDAEYSIRISEFSKIKNINKSILNHKTTLNLAANDVNWKTYYGIRNKLNLVKHHYSIIGLIVAMILISGALIIDVVRSVMKKQSMPCRKIIRLYMDAIKDGTHDHLGKNEKYLPFNIIK